MRLLRLLLAASGGYAFAAGLVAVIGAALPLAGMARAEAATLGGMLGLLACAAVLIWMAASPRPVRTAVIVFASAAIMIGGAPLMVHG